MTIPYRSLAATEIITNDDDPIDVTLKDIDNETLSIKEGSQSSLQTSDENTRGLLAGVLKELKIMNMHLSILTDTIINKQEVE